MRRLFRGLNDAPQAYHQTAATRNYGWMRKIYVDLQVVASAKLANSPSLPS